MRFKLLDEHQDDAFGVLLKWIEHDDISRVVEKESIR